MMRIGFSIRAAAAGLVLALAAVAGAAQPAAAAVPDAWAFAYLDNPAPGAGPWVMDPARQGGTFTTRCGGLATAREFTLGMYEVTFPCSVTNVLGIVHVTAVDDAGRYCNAGTWQASGAAVTVIVFCFDATGKPDRSRFAVLYTTSSGPAPLPYAYVYSDFTGTPLASYHSAGAPNSVLRLGPGRYEVKLPGLSWWQYTGSLQVTAVHPNQTATRCKVGNWGWSGPDRIVIVACFDRLSRPADSWWTLTYHNLRSVYGPAWPTRFGYVWQGGPAGPTNVNSTGVGNTVTPVGAGQYVVEFPNLAADPSHMQVTAEGFDPAYCQPAQPWVLGGGAIIAQPVVCFDGFGARADRRFFATAAGHVP